MPWIMMYSIPSWLAGPVFTKLFRFRMKIKLKFQNE